MKLYAIQLRNRSIIREDRSVLEIIDADFTFVNARLARHYKIDGVEGHVVGVLVRGAVYGVRASDGEVAWRRYVGFESDAFPVPVAEQSGSDLLVVDAARGELLRLKSATGELVWRLPCPSPISTPIVSGDRAFVSCGRDADSMLLSVDLKAADGAKVGE